MKKPQFDDMTDSQLEGGFTQMMPMMMMMNGSGMDGMFDGIFDFDAGDDDAVEIDNENT